MRSWQAGVLNVQDKERISKPPPDQSDMDYKIHAGFIAYTIGDEGSHWWRKQTLTPDVSPSDMRTVWVEF